MSFFTRFHIVATYLLIFAAIIPLQAQKSALPTPPDSTLYTTYSLYSNSGQTTVDWIVCGSTQDSEGCYASGNLGPFVAVGAMLEGDPFVIGNVVTRAIYVVDSGDASLKLYVYRKTDTVTAESDTVTVTLTKTVTLPLTGGSSAHTSMAANRGYLFIGTDQSEQAAMVKKSNLTVTSVGEVPGNVAAITSDQYGYVTITNAGDNFTDFTVLGPDGQLEEYGGGTDFVLGTTQAVSLVPLTNANANPAPPRMEYRPKASPNTQ